MVAPWWVFQRAALFFVILCWLIILILYCCWRRMGSPMPKERTFLVSVLAQLGILSLIAVLILYQSYTFGLNFCAVAVNNDVWPVLIGFTFLALLFVIASV